jgi:GAF domain/Pyridoxamine 5'-phosphate oxidase
VSELSIPLESIMPCFQGVIPSWVTTCSADGIPNATIVSIVQYVDSDRVALTRQFMNKSRINLDANPQAQLVVVNPCNGEQFALDTHFLHTETDGPIFDAVAANLDAIASMTGMLGVFRLRGVDIHGVLACEPFGAIELRSGASERRPVRDMLPMLDEFTRRLSVCTEYSEAVRVGLEALDDLFGFGYSVLLTADERSDRLFAVASNGYMPSGVGAEVPIGYGPIGVAAQRWKVVCVPSVTRSRSLSAAIQDSIRQSGGEPSAFEIELPGLARADSAAAVPLIAHGELTGVLYLESERPGDFGPGDERLLRILGVHLAGALVGLQADRGESAPPEPTPTTTPDGEPLGVSYYQADDSVFVDGAYVVKGIPGRILWKLLREHDADGRVSFTNRELRLDERLGLPPGQDNLEARLLVLRKRLAALDCGIGLDRAGRGRMVLHLEAPLTLSEVPTAGPMRAAHEPSGDA